MASTLAIDLNGTQFFKSVSRYGATSQNKNSKSTISPNQQQLKIDGNGWRKIPINYVITPDTILEFEFKSTGAGEVHGIGFDNDNTISNTDQRNFFQLYGNGLENFGLANFNNYSNPVVPGEWQTYRIRVGDFFTGSRKYLTFANDQDVANSIASSQFRNLKLYEGPPSPTPVTVEYSHASDSVVANLTTGLVTYQSGTSPDTPLKIMSVGDSNTRGVGSDPAGYRNDLWANLIAANQHVDFVGSMTSGFTNFDDNHEGHGGWTIRDILYGRSSVPTGGNINTWLNQSQPDVILLMIGTNDTKSRTLDQMKNDLRTLINTITAQSPNTYLFVGSIPPTLASANRTQLTQAYNAAIPGIVSSQANQGKKVSFVDIASSLSTADLLPDGVHLIPEGYAKVANTWYGALNNLINTGLSQNIAASVQNIVGSDFHDELIGNAGANILKGDGGYDLLTGMAGKDIFVLAKGQGADRITDFKWAEGDRLGLLAGDLTPGQLSIIQSSGDALIAFGSETLAILDNTDANFLQNNAANLFVTLNPSTLNPV